MQMRLNYIEDELTEFKAIQDSNSINSVILIINKIFSADTRYLYLKRYVKRLAVNKELLFIYDLKDIIEHKVVLSYKGGETIVVTRHEETQDENNSSNRMFENEHVDPGTIYPDPYYDEEDNVNRPQHYEQYGLETIRTIQGQSTQEEYQGFLKGNVMKYLSRYQFKNGLEDLYKAQYYLNKLIAEINDDEVEE